ncbi:MAG: D-alanyl-D-alanine carboxypeptidase/D-alanyl-D-alanine-endopeptidase [Bacteroidales bacterium]
MKSSIVSFISKTSVFVVVLFSFFNAYTQTEPQKIINEFYNKKPDLRSAFVGFHAIDMSTDSVIVDLNSTKSMMPASLIKLFTTAAALDYLGEDFQFKTYISHTGTIDDSGVLDGDIVIHGSGDPTLGSKYFPEKKHFIDSIVQKIINYGIQSINGKIIIDCSIFDSQSIPTTWVWQDMGLSYAAGVYPISMNDNIFTITFANAESDTLKRKGLSRIKRGTPPGIPASPFEYNEYDSVDIDPQNGRFIVKGSIPAPQEILGLELIQRFMSRDVCNISQEYMSVVIPVRGITDTIGALTSPKLHEIVEVANKKSINNYAEYLLKYLGYNVYDDGSYSVGTNVVTDYIDSVGVNSRGVYIYDGSGLSRYNVVTPQHVTYFLQNVTAKNYADTFINSLSVSGTSGTLKSYPFPKNMTNKIQGKTGSMTRIRNLAGYMTTKSGEKVVFCVMMNGHTCNARGSKKLITELLANLYTNY